jgi:hypothetical protein
MELKIWSLSNPGFEPLPFDRWPNALTTCANRAHKKRKKENLKERRKFERKKERKTKIKI